MRLPEKSFCIALITTLMVAAAPAQTSGEVTKPQNSLDERLTQLQETIAAQQEAITNQGKQISEQRQEINTLRQRLEGKSQAISTTSGKEAASLLNASLTSTSPTTPVAAHETQEAEKPK